MPETPTRDIILIWVFLAVLLAILLVAAIHVHGREHSRSHRHAHPLAYCARYKLAPYDPDCSFADKTSCLQQVKQRGGGRCYPDTN